MDFHPGTELGVFVVSLTRGESTTLLAAIEGPQSDEVTLECTDLTRGEPSGFTISVRSSILADMTSDQLQPFEQSGGEVRLTVDDGRYRAWVHPDRYGHRNALIAVRDDVTGEELATIAAIRGGEGFDPTGISLLVIAGVIIIKRHKENMRAIERCVPLNNVIRIEVPGDGAYQGGTEVHKNKTR